MLKTAFCGPQEEEGQAGDQDQEEKRWNKRTQQMLHGLQVQKKAITVVQLFYRFQVDQNSCHSIAV